MAAGSKKPSGPSLELRATPRFALQPQVFLLTGELKGDRLDVELNYCLRQEWRWDDDTSSVRESDCDPWEPGMVIEKRFSITKTLGYGDHTIELHLSKNKKELFVASVSVSVLTPGIPVGASERSVVYNAGH